MCVGHQLPIWVSRLAAEHKRLWHNPKSRECALGSVTSLTFDGDELTSVSYAVPPPPPGRWTRIGHNRPDVLPPVGVGGLGYAPGIKQLNAGVSRSIPKGYTGVTLPGER